MPRHSAKVDVNQSAFVAAVRAMPGGDVLHLHTLGQGAPDLLVAANVHGKREQVLVELKRGPKAKLTSDEQKWHAHWLGIVLVAWCPQQLLNYWQMPVGPYVRTVIWGYEQELMGKDRWAFDEYAKALRDLGKVVPWPTVWDASDRALIPAPAFVP